MTLQKMTDDYAKARGVTKDAIADKLGISRSSFFNKMRGSYEFSLSEAFELSRMLGITLDELHELIATKGAA